nr:hypothetical protein [Tanacetum cinerariifolium]
MKMTWNCYLDEFGILSGIKSSTRWRSGYMRTCCRGHRPFSVVEGKGKDIVIEEQATQCLLALHTPKWKSITDQFILQRRTPTTKEESTRPSAQPLDDTPANIVQLGEDVGKHENIKEKTVELDQGQAGPDPGKKSTRKGQNQNKTKLNQEKTGSMEKPGDVKSQSQSRKQKREEIQTQGTNIDKS